MQNPAKRAENNDQGESARERIVNSAEKLFAEKGFNGSSIREITSNANSNIAAVNYHFGGKEKLYYEVFHRRMSVVRDIRLDSIEKVMSKEGHETTLEELLRAFSTAFLEPLIDEDTGGRFIQLMIHEMTNPRLPKGMFADELIKPTLAALTGAIRKICPGLDQKQIMLAVFSLIGQLLHNIRISEALDIEQCTDIKMPSLDELIEHIVAFSAGGIRAMSGKDK